MIIVFSGFRDNELQIKIEKQGGIVKDNFTKNTDYLIVKDDTIINNPTEKVKKAMDNNIKILTKDELIKML